MNRAALSPLCFLMGAALLCACDLSPQPLPPSGDSNGGPHLSSGSTTGGSSGGASGGQTPPFATDAGPSNDASSLGAIAAPSDGGSRSNDGGSAADAFGDAMNLDGAAPPQDGDAGRPADVSGGDGSSADAITPE
jgi:hypothetical protein